MLMVSETLDILKQEHKIYWNNSFPLFPVIMLPNLPCLLCFKVRPSTAIWYLLIKWTNVIYFFRENQIAKFYYFYRNQNHNQNVAEVVSYKGFYSSRNGKSLAMSQAIHERYVEIKSKDNCWILTLIYGKMRLKVLV